MGHLESVSWMFNCGMFIRSPHPYVFTLCIINPFRGDEALLLNCAWELVVCRLAHVSDAQFFISSLLQQNEEFPEI